MTRGLALLSLLFTLVLVPCAEAASRRERGHPPSARFAALRTAIHRAGNLSRARRHRALSQVALGQRQTARHHPCGALNTLEGIRSALAPAPGAVSALNALELSLVRTATPALSCAMATRQVWVPPEPPIVGGPIQPMARVRLKPDEQAGTRAPQLSTRPGKINRGPETVISPVPSGSRFASTSFAAPFTFIRITDLGTPALTDHPAEPSEASARQVVWYTGNSQAAFSLDGGATFTSVDPRTMFPEVGYAFCCDQQVLYAPQINRFIWLIQYWCAEPDQYCERSGSTNRVRLLVASPQAILANRDHPAAAWQVWALAPGRVGAKREWFDFPALGLGTHSLYITSNVFGGDGGNFRAGMVARVNLAALQAGRGFALSYHLDPDGASLRPAQESGDTGYLATHQSDNVLLTLAWPEGAPVLFAHRTQHTLDATLDYTSPTGPGGNVDWQARDDDRVLGGARRGSELWFAWSEGRSICIDACAGGHARPAAIWEQPHVHIVVIDDRSFRLIHERFIYNRQFAIAYPSLASNSRGDMAMTFSYGGGSAGDVSLAAGLLTGNEGFRQVAVSATAGDQGDFAALRTDWPDRSRFTAAGYINTSDSYGGATAQWLFYRFSDGTPRAGRRAAGR